jgi:dTMP kinase
MSTRRCFESPPPGLDSSSLTGSLIVIEGPDSSGRSTHIRLLAEWLEQNGYPVAQVGLKRSHLVGRELERAKQGNVLSPRTMSLFYATDFYDQLENIIVPAMRAGAVVLADRYVFTLMARDLVRGADAGWLASLYSKAIVPDAVFYFDVSAQTLVDRTLYANGSLDYWESGMDVGLSRDWFGSFVRYQRRMRQEFKQLQKSYHFESVNANRSLITIHRDLKSRVLRVLQRSYTPQPYQPEGVGT